MGRLEDWMGVGRDPQLIESCERVHATPGAIATADYDRFELLYEVQTVLAQPCGIEESCDALLSIVTRAVRVRTAVLLDITGDSLRAFTWAASGITPVAVEEARENAVKMLADLSWHDVSSNVVDRASLLREGVAEQASPQRSFAVFALSIDEGRILGVFQIEGAVAFSDGDVLFINAVSSQLAVALDRRHAKHALETARREVEQANRRLTGLQAIAKCAPEGATVDESLSAVLGAICTMFRTDVAAVLLASADGKKLRRQASIGLENLDDAEISIGAGAGRVAVTSTPIVFDNPGDLDDLNPILRSNGICAMLGAPMRARNHLIGVVYVASRGHRAFTSDELRFLELVADRIGTILDNAILYDQALAAVRNRDAVMGSVSHDLRNPLSTIQMCTELLETDDPRLARPVSIIRRSVDVMSRLIGDLRDIESIEVGHLAIKIGSEDACVLVRDAVDGVRAVAFKKPVRLEVRLPTRELVLDCDRIRVVQILTNLLSNAIKFTSQHGVIMISLVKTEPGHARFSVEDTGCGISVEDLPRVFDRYWQAQETAHLGTGLGLAIAKGAVEAHGGTISVASRVGQGTTFSFILPTTHHSW